MRLLLALLLLGSVGCATSKSQTIVVDCSEYNKGPIKGFFLGKNKILIRNGSCRQAGEPSNVKGIYHETNF